jgi:hypothetical protein
MTIYRAYLKALSKDFLGKVIEIVPPVGGVVGMMIHIPKMRYAMLFEISVHALADAYQSILIAT